MEFVNDVYDGFMQNLGPKPFKKILQRKFLKPL